jgi:5-methyltetrahydropteroyltriglutamate--homocysteine methyltransferase
MRPTPESEEFPDWVRTTAPRVTFPSNNGPVSLRDSAAVRRDIANFKAALEGVSVADAFMTAASPGVVDTFMPSSYYRSEEEYLRAVADAMRDEYKAVVDAGFVLQIDCPDLAMSRHSRFATLSGDEFLQTARMHIKVLNIALEGLPAERMRLHTCWGNYEGPHNHDVPLQDIIDIVLEARVGAVSIEAANPRHAHEWKVFESVQLPAGVKLVPGVIDSCTNYIEHPDLVAERLVRFATVVGKEPIAASAHRLGRATWRRASPGPSSGRWSRARGSPPASCGASSPLSDLPTSPGIGAGVFL